MRRRRLGHDISFMRMHSLLLGEVQLNSSVYNSLFCKRMLLPDRMLLKLQTAPFPLAQSFVTPVCCKTAHKATQHLCVSIKINKGVDNDRLLTVTFQLLRMHAADWPFC